MNSKYSREKHLETVLKDLISKYFYLGEVEVGHRPRLIDLDGCDMSEEHRELYMQLMELIPEVIYGKG